MTESKVDDKCESNFVESMDDLIGFFDNDEEKPHANDPPPALRVKTVSSHERELIPEASEATPISARSGLKMNRNDRTKISEPKRIIRREPSTKKFDCEDVGMSAWSSDSDGAKKMESPRVFLEPKRLVNSLGASDSNESPSVSSSSKHKSKHPYTEKRNDTPVQASAKKGNSTSEKKKMDKRSVESKTESSSSRLSVVPLGADSKDSNRLVENLSSDVPSSAKKAEPKKRQRRELTPKIESAPKHLHPEQENEAKRNDNTLPELHDNNISQTQVASNGSSSQATTGKDIEARARIAKNVNASSLRELRVGDTKKFHVRPHNNLHSQLSHLLAKDKANEIIIELTSVKTNAPLPGIETQGILEFLEKSKIYAVTLWIRIANENLQYDINLYGDCKLKIICQNVVVSDQLIPFKPSLQTVPFPFYTFSHATKGTAINDRPISISIRVIESLAKADHPIFESSQSFDGSQTSEWNFLDLPDGIIQAAFNANGFKKVSLPLINFHKEVQYGKGVVSALHALPSGLNKAEASYVMLMSPADLAAGEWRCILRWNAEPQDLDLYCTMSKEPWKIFWNNQNRGGRNELAKGKIELDIDVRSGKGPETITFTPLAGVNYRFFVRNYSGWSKNREFRRTLQSADQVPLSQSGATLTVMMGNEVKMFRVDEDLVFGEDNLPAITWLVFEIVNGEIREINKIVCEDLQQVQMN